MNLHSSFAIFLILSSATVTEADDDRVWRREMEQKMEEVLRLVQRHEDMILQRDRVIELQNRDIEKHSEEIEMLKRSIQELKQGCRVEQKVPETESIYLFVCL
jgi:uncharacterized protein (DUF3084 family)